MQSISINGVIEEKTRPETDRRLIRMGLMALASQSLLMAGEKIQEPVLGHPKNKPFYRRFDRKKY